MKISQLVKRTGVPKETIHFYIREGLLRKPRKSSVNTADYNERYVDQIQLIKDLQNLIGGGRIKVTGRLVRQDEQRVIDQAASDGDTLLLTTGKLCWSVIQAITQPDAFGQFDGPFPFA